MHRFTPVLVLLFGVFSLVAVNLRAHPSALAATSNTINFQARLQAISGAMVPDGNYNVEFKLYSASSGGTALWTEDYFNNASNGIRTVNGYVTANLGSITAFPTTINWDQQLWLTMNVGGTTTGTPTLDGEMSPRLQLTAVPYAFKAGQLAQANSGGTLFSTLSILAPTGVGNQNFQIQDQGAGGTYNLLMAPSGTDGYVKLQTGTPVQQSGSLDSSGTANATTLQAGTGGIVDGGALTFSGTTTTTFTTPNGSSIATKINVPLYDPGAFNQIIALGLPATANTNARAITFLDARTSAHQPTIALLSPNEGQIFGLTYDGSNTTAYLSASNASIALEASGRTILSATYTSPTSGNVTIGDPTNVQGSLVFANSTNNAGVIITSGVTSTQYTIQLPTAIGTAGQCLGIASVASTVETLGYTSCGGGTGFVSLQASTPGTPDSGNLNISGVGIFGTGVKTSSLDTPASAGTLSLGSAFATTINLGGGSTAQTLSIGNGSGNDTLNIGTGSGTDAITIGSTGDAITLGSAVTAATTLTANTGITVGSSGGNGLFTNNGATVNTVAVVANLPTGGAIGTASLTVDAYTAASISQTTAGQTITIPTPTASTTYGRIFYVTNVGTASFVILGATINPGATATLVWSNTNGGASWTFAGTDKASIVNQTTQQTGANFNIDGTGTIGTSLTTPLVQSSGNLSIQAAGTNTLSLDTAGAGTVSVGGTNAGTVTIANNAAAHTVNIATGAAVQTVTIGSTNGASVTNIQGGTGNINLLTNSASASIIAKTQTNSTTGFQIQNASSVALFNLDTTTGNITLGTGSNTIVFTPSGGLIASGTAQHTKTILLTAEYTGAVLDVASDASCVSANNGTMTSGYDSTSSRMNYYSWTSTQATNQCYDVVVQVPIPADFNAWTAAPNVQLKSSNTSNSAYGIAIIDSSNTYDANYTSSYAAPGTLSTSWGNMSTSNLSGTYTAGDYLTIKVRLTAKNGAAIELGNIKLTYSSKY